MIRFQTLAAALFAAALAAPAAQALDSKSVLTLEMAMEIAVTCEAKAVEEGWRPINIAVYDDGGNLVVFHRMDGAFLGSIQIAQMKGHTSAMFPFSTRLLSELAYGKDGEPGSLPGIAEIPGIAAFPGGVPIMTADEQQVGSVGVSGATGDQDEECAEAGIAAVSDLLE